MIPSGPVWIQIWWKDLNPAQGARLHSHTEVECSCSPMESTLHTNYLTFSLHCTYTPDTLQVHSISNWFCGVNVYMQIWKLLQKAIYLCCLPVSGVTSHPHQDKRLTDQSVLSVCSHRSHGEWHELKAHWLSVLPVSNDTNIFLNVYMHILIMPRPQNIGKVYAPSGWSIQCDGVIDCCLWPLTPPTDAIWLVNHSYYTISIPPNN